MKVSIKDFAVTMEIKNKGVEIDVFGNDGTHRGDLVVTKTARDRMRGGTKRICRVMSRD